MIILCRQGILCCWHNAAARRALHGRQASAPRSRGEPVCRPLLLEAMRSTIRQIRRRDEWRCRIVEDGRLDSKRRTRQPCSFRCCNHVDLDLDIVRANHNGDLARPGKTFAIWMKGCPYDNSTKTGTAPTTCASDRLRVAAAGPMLSSLAFSVWHTRSASAARVDARCPWRTAAKRLRQLQDAPQVAAWFGSGTSWGCSRGAAHLYQTTLDPLVWPCCRLWRPGSGNVSPAQRAVSFIQ